MPIDSGSGTVSAVTLIALRTQDKQVPVLGAQIVPKSQSKGKFQKAVVLAELGDTSSQ